MQKTAIQMAMQHYIGVVKGCEVKMSKIDRYSDDYGDLKDKMLQARKVAQHLQSLLPAEQKIIEDAFNRGVLHSLNEVEDEYKPATGTTASDYYLTTFTALDGDKSKENG